MGRKNFKFSAKILVLRSELGMTIAEIVVAVAIVAILSTLVLFSFNPRLQLGKSNDSRRKADLKRISIALEDYSGDHPCYPSVIYQNTGCLPSGEIKPYLNNIPCDPRTHEQYPYARPDDCKEFVIYATLETENIASYGLGNYAQTSSNLRVVPVVGTPTPTGISVPTFAPTPTSPPAGNYYGCFFGSGCPNYCCPIPGAWRCPSINYQIPDCAMRCDGSAATQCH